MGNATIVPSHETNLVIAGPGNSAGVNFTRLYAVLALYYWNGTAWAPAPVVVEGGGTGEFTLRAWVYANQNEP
ncbi:thermopsin family protease [Vulcanisaeta sp. JCM 14467]|uniref:thermopsin family protease n=1 Tax=Vulcanisaeta sp. JCM 14467 TaxID=1295370 RepID=UPI0006CFA11B|nr:thermopsin family protease [Vulcanisaeta sp. JCM 14467]